MCGPVEQAASPFSELTPPVRFHRRHSFKVLRNEPSSQVTNFNPRWPPPGLPCWLWGCGLVEVHVVQSCSLDQGAQRVELLPECCIVSTSRCSGSWRFAADASLLSLLSSGHQRPPKPSRSAPKCTDAGSILVRQLQLKAIHRKADSRNGRLQSACTSMPLQHLHSSLLVPLAACGWTMKHQEA